MIWLPRFLLFRPDPAKNCTPRVQEALKLARRAADDRFHDYVDTGHLMLGTLLLGHGVGLCAMTRLGVNFLRLQRDIEKSFPAGRRTEHRDSIPYTPVVGSLLLDYGCREAKALGHSYLGTEHLLLGILRSKRGAVFKALRAQSITVEAAREAVRLCLSDPPDSGKDKPSDPTTAAKS